MSEPSKGDAEGSPPMKKQDQGHEEQKEGKEKRGKDGDSTFSGVKGDEWDLSNMTGPLKPKTRVFVPEDQSRASLGDHQGKILNFSVDQGWDWTEADFDIEAELDTIKSGHFVAWIGLENYDDPFTDDKEWDEHFGASMEKLLQDLKNLEKRPNKIFVSSEVFYSVKAVEYLIELGEWAGIKDWVIMVEKEHNGDIDSYLGVPPFGQALVDGSLPAKHLCVSSPSDRIQESFLRHLNGVAGSVSNLEVLCFLTPKGNRIPSHEHEKPLDSLLALLQPNKIFSRVSTLVFLGTELGTDGYPNLKPLVKQLAHNCKDQKKIPILLLSNIRVKGFNNFGHLLTEIEKVVMPILGKGTDDTYEAARFFVPDNQVAGGQLKDSETRFYTSFKFGTMDECILPRIKDMLGCIGFERAVGSLKPTFSWFPRPLMATKQWESTLLLLAIPKGTSRGVLLSLEAIGIAINLLAASGLNAPTRPMSQQRCPSLWQKKPRSRELRSDLTQIQCKCSVTHIIFAPIPSATAKNHILLNVRWTRHCGMP